MRSLSPAFGSSRSSAAEADAGTAAAAPSALAFANTSRFACTSRTKMLPARATRSSAACEPCVRPAERRQLVQKRGRGSRTCICADDHLFAVAAVDVAALDGSDRLGSGLQLCVHVNMWSVRYTSECIKAQHIEVQSAQCCREAEVP